MPTKITPTHILPTIGLRVDNIDELGAPTLLILDEARLFLDNSLFAARIKAWLKTLRKKNAVIAG